MVEAYCRKVAKMFESRPQDQVAADEKTPPKREPQPHVTASAGNDYLEVSWTPSMSLSHRQVTGRACSFTQRCAVGMLGIFTAEMSKVRHHSVIRACLSGGSSRTAGPYALRLPTYLQWSR